MADFQVHTATDADVMELQEYATQLFSEKLPGIYRRSAPTLDQEYEFVRSRIEPANSTLLLARSEGGVVGLLDFMGGVLPEEAHGGVLGLSVSRDHRGLGIGSALVQELLMWAPTRGISRVEVRAWVNNPRALALYERLGFEREGVLRNAVIVDGESIDVVVLSRLLEALRYPAPHAD